MNQIRVLTVTGTPYERGFAHGQAFADEITAFTEERLRLSTAPRWAGRTATYDGVLALGKACLAHHEAFAPDLMQELRGIAEATGLGLAELLIMNGFTDFVDVVFHGANDAGGCTAFAVAPPAAADGRGYVGQTWDMHVTATPCLAGALSHHRGCPGAGCHAGG